METKYELSLLAAYNVLSASKDARIRDIEQQFQQDVLDLKQQAYDQGVVGEGEPFPWQKIEAELVEIAVDLKIPSLFS